MKSALVVAGAAAGAAAAATWFGKRKRHLSAVDTSRASLVEPESAELPIGRSADPAIDASLSRSRLPQDETSGAALLAEHEPLPHRRDIDLALDDVWSATPGIAEPEQSEGYDAVIPEDMGAVWIERATETTHEHRPHASDPSDIPQLEDLVSQGTIDSSRGLDDDEIDENGSDSDNEDDIGDNELDEPGTSEDEPGTSERDR